VHESLDAEHAAAALAEASGQPVLHAHSAAPDRATYLLRPDLGRRLDDTSRERLAAYREATRQADSPDVAIVVADGLSARAVHRHAAAVVAHVAARLREDVEPWSMAPVVLVEQGRVAIGDDVGALLGAALVVVLLGERPGLSAPDSLGAYLTWAPRVGRTDAERNCVSNIRPEGLDPVHAARTIAWLAREARRRRLTGTALRDEAPLERGVEAVRVREGG
jgi:ethanolamine ammonia-lyase small subunit